MLNDIQYIANKLHKKWVKGFKQLGNNPKALTKSLYIDNVLPSIDKYYITDKADGLRSFLLINSTYIKYITSTDINYIQVENIFKNEYIFDVELVNNVLYIFDVIMYNDVNVTNITFAERYLLLQEFQKMLTKHHIEPIKVKTFYELEFKNYQKLILDLYKYKAKNLPYEIDGIIFVESTKDYNSTLNLKWKPAEMLTIDFLALYDEKLEKYILTNGIKYETMNQFGIHPNKKFDELVKEFIVNKDYIPVPFYNSLKPNIFYYDHGKGYENGSQGSLHGHIIELSLSKTNNWKFHKIRYDRDVELKNGTYYGNNYKIAETTFQSILNPLSLNDLVLPYTSLVKDQYFKKQDDSYKQVKRFNNSIKKDLIQRYAFLYTNKNVIMDLASGRGSDLKNYIDNGVQNLLMLEMDIGAIDELINRKYSILTQKSNKGCNMCVLNANLNNDFKKTIQLIQDNFTDVNLYIDNFINVGTIPIIFCHFAMHYLLETEKSSTNIISLISYYLEKNGVFIMTIFDGQKVFDLLKRHNGKWAPNKKYMISYDKKQPSTFSGFGHKIKVLLPLSDKPYEEYLVDPFALDKIFKKHNIYRTEERCFGDFLHENPDSSRLNIDESDKQFINLYKYYIYKKMK